MDNQNHPNITKIFVSFENEGARALGKSIPVDKADSVEHYVGSVQATVAYNDDGRSAHIFPKQLYRFYLYFLPDIFYRYSQVGRERRFEFRLRK